MPGLVVFRRRWSVGSDDLVVPGAFLLTTHLICFVIVLISLLILEYDLSILNVKLLFYLQICYLAILLGSVCVEAGICIISMRGSILDSAARTTINFWIYLKSMVIFFDITWLVLSTMWLTNCYFDAPIDEAKQFFMAIVICNWALVFITLITIWCTFDAAGRSWVKMKKYQRSMRETESRFNYKRSGSMNRNWRQRKVMRAYQDSWDHRCRLLFCCMGGTDRNRNSFTDIARLLSDFFRELDVVPSDVVAGLVLLRKFQKIEREAVVRQRKNGTYEFLSGVPITDRTQFLALNDAKNYDFFQTVIHYMYFAQGAYGWPMYFIINRSKMYNLLPELKCFTCCCRPQTETPFVIEDNCCFCNYAALKKTLQVGDVEIIYATYHVDVGETPFFVAVDYTQKKIVVSIRGTLSMKDILTDLNADGEVLPLSPPRDDWLGHKGMVQAAIYIKNKLEEEGLIERALSHNRDRETSSFGLVLVGHSLGAGTAAILAILMKADYPSLQCFSYSPPGGLLSMPAVEYTKSFITSIVLGKDVVPRIGLHQMEALRADLINAIQRSVDPKWKTISCSVICCGCGPEPTSVVEMSGKDTHINQYQEQRDSARSTSAHPTDSSIALTLHQPLYPPGRIIHIVRHHPKPEEQKYDSGWRSVLKSHEPVYQAIWADTYDFDEVLISPVMLQDHMPDKVLSALKKVVSASGPRKPQRQTSNAFSTLSNDFNHYDFDVERITPLGSIDPISVLKPEGSLNRLSHNSYPNISSINVTPATHRKICHETSFANLQIPFDITTFSGLNSSKTSSIAGSILGRSQLSSALYDISVDESITTVTRRSPSVPSETATVIINDRDPLPIQRLKTVAFDIDADSVAIGKYMPISHVSKDALYRQYSVRAEKRKRNLPITALRRASDVSRPIDSLHDDSLGLAPLASPETLSEISSISSRTSAPISLANSIELYFHNLNLAADKTNGRAVLEGIFESQLHTPKIMRRAPKFSENLSNCAEDSRNVDQYKRMGRVFVTLPPIFDGVHSNNNNQKSSFDSSDDSYESVQSLSRFPSKHDSSIEHNSIGCNVLQPKQSSKSLDPLDSVAIEQKPTERNTKKLTFSDSEILNEAEVTEVKDNHSLLFEHKRSLMGDIDKHTNCGSADTTFYSASSSIEQFSTPGKLMYCSNSSGNGISECQSVPEEVIIIRPGVLESHFPVLESVSYLADLNSAETIDDSNIPRCSTSINVPTKQKKHETVGGRIRKRLSSEDFIFTRTEDFPLVSQLGEKSNKRKAAVYPVGSNCSVSKTKPPTCSNIQIINTTTETSTVTKSSSNSQLQRKTNYLNSQYSSNPPNESPNIMLPIKYSEESNV
ncbi:uncharacterized protein LOC120773756 isoform X1 [Bactrocera tryoni]|uniref:uncharacterized protein LOC120773756 isoform X1 n=1 Tax=Bactrocera tryoni TaxID=59916 RepID=UPI001A98C33E|nr:uncharacterized protein LOC120773756 isoform X1 [Bactrocera tryoni]XP_039958759.1 uncharacterized protein LOC120773756 isoform X1 [Bactrocera tryoni]XP_039958760.1 uncharacterized protein LOC120773756 isoform X1 [Bactrocera tryoni]XP_039958761.1 uncharacterized protein LOC120773756 isoform X1 [Bactrocera tryoni]XP_039958762.1 uncharacterized protein LOC120773756 isoform X1 [Bactrocera tryoni]XP_039958764.1 uncharacterized protein LOC120773756 isoform X1 [Bactrocera tryoni]